MKQLINSKWFTEVDKFTGVIKVKADDGATTPICSIATPAGVTWMQNTMWLNNALKKAETITKMPELYKRAVKLVEQIEMSDYIHIGKSGDGHKLNDNKALRDLKKLIEQLS